LYSYFSIFDKSLPQLTNLLVEVKTDLQIPIRTTYKANSTESTQKRFLFRINSFLFPQYCFDVIVGFAAFGLFSLIFCRSVVSARDILAWVNFINRFCDAFAGKDDALQLAYIHGAVMVFVDGLGSGPTAAVR
jgi:hypothetical protein